MAENIYDALGLTPGDQAETEGWLAQIRHAADGLINEMKGCQALGEPVDPLTIFLALFAAADTSEKLINLIAITAELVYREAVPREEVPPL